MTTTTQSTAAVATDSPAAGAPAEQQIADDAQPAATAPASESHRYRRAGRTPAPDRLLIVEVTVGVEVADVGKAVTTLIDIGERYEAQVYGSDVQLSEPRDVDAERWSSRCRRRTSRR